MSRKRERRGMSLIEVLLSIVILTALFLAVSATMIGSSDAESKAASHSQDVYAANYLLHLAKSDPFLWKNFPDSPQDACGTGTTPLNDPGPQAGGTWHTLPPNCTNTPSDIYQIAYQWNESTPVSDAANITVWVMSNVDGRVDIYELHGFTHQTPSGLDIGGPPPPPPSPSSSPGTPTPCPTNCATSTPKPTPKPTPTHSPTPRPSSTPRPSPTATPIPI